MNDSEILDAVAQAMTLRTRAGLTQTVAELINTGRIPPEARLPTIRAVAEALGMSRTAVGQAWRQLQQQGILQSNRRGGTIVIAQPTPAHAKKFELMIRASITMPVDLGNLFCQDMPNFDLGRAFQYAAAHPEIGNQFAHPISAELKKAIMKTWPFQTDSFLSMHGTMDALEISLAALVQPGDSVVVATPTLPRVFDILESLNSIPVLIPMHDDGMDLNDIRQAQISKPAAFVYQPNLALPTGRSVNPEWISEASLVLEGNLPILEIDQIWPLGEPRLSLGTELPDQVLHIRSFNYAFGADMRQAVVGGNPRLIDMLWNRLSYSSRYVSRISQLAQAFLLQDPGTLATLEWWQTEIRRRHHTFAEALGELGLPVNYDGPPCIWLSVPNEHSVCTRLSRRGIVVYPGSLFHPKNGLDPHISINAAARSNDIGGLAKEIALAVRQTRVGSC